jgi:kumamolisin
VTISIGTAEKLFGTKWNLYDTSTPGQLLALPVDSPTLPKGLKGNVDTVAGLRLTVSQGTASAAGGTPTRTGTVGQSCVQSTDPAALAFGSGLFPNQILTAYGIAPLQAGGLLGQGVRVAIVGEGPTPADDLDSFRQCFGFPGTALGQHGSTSLKPILESSLDTQAVAMVAPRLAGFDLYVRSLNEEADDGDALGFLQLLAAPLQATTNGAKLPDVISVSYGVCEPQVSPYTASRTLVGRQLAATAALGITVVVAAGDSGSSACAHGVPANQLTSADKQIATSWPATSPWVLAVGGTNLTLDAANAISSTGPWNDTAYPAPYTAIAGGGGGVSTISSRPSWQPGSGKRRVPDVAVFADESPGYAIICSTQVQGCGASYRNGQSLAYVGGTSAAAPLVAGMIALWTQDAKQRGLKRPGFVPPLLYSLAPRNPQAFLDITSGSNSLFGGKCCSAGPGFDQATGLGSPLADEVAALLR